MDKREKIRAIVEQASMAGSQYGVNEDAIANYTDAIMALMPGVAVKELEWEGERAEVGLPGWSYSTHHFAELGKWGAFCWLDGSMYVLGSDDWTEQANFDAEHDARSACQRDLYQRLSALQPAGELVEAARDIPPLIEAAFKLGAIDGPKWSQLEGALKMYRLLKALGDQS